MDRLFTVAYLPSCLALLLVCVAGGERQQRWMGAAHTRISTCYASFTALLLLVPLVRPAEPWARSALPLCAAAARPAPFFPLA